MNIFMIIYRENNKMSCRQRGHIQPWLVEMPDVTERVTFQTF